MEFCRNNKEIERRIIRQDKATANTLQPEYTVRTIKIEWIQYICTTECSEVAKSGISVVKDSALLNEKEFILQEDPESCSILLVFCSYSTTAGSVS